MEIVRFLLIGLVAAGVGSIYWSLVSLFTKKQWIRGIITGILLTITISLCVMFRQ